MPGAVKIPKADLGVSLGFLQPQQKLHVPFGAGDGRDITAHWPKPQAFGQGLGFKDDPLTFFRVTHDAAFSDIVFAHLELGLDQGHHVGDGGHARLHPWRAPAPLPTPATRALER